MTRWLTIAAVRHHVAIAGQVTDAQTGKIIAGALVAITAAPAPFTDRLSLQQKQYGDQWETMVERPDRTRTRADGHFHFMDLPAGQYTLAASLPGQGTRYGTAQATVTVALDANGNIRLVTTAIVLAPTTLKGRITAQAANEPEPVPVFMARIGVKGSGESTFSDKEGNYRLIGLEVGTRTVQVVVKGYQTDVSTVALGPAGAEQTLNVTLSPATS